VYNAYNANVVLNESLFSQLYMNYQHQYHAGNFADVCKHLVLAELAQQLCQKESPFGYLETHAGAGIYDLTDIPAQKTREFSQGIEKFMKAAPLLSDRPTVSRYLAVLKKAGYPTYYPGSPYLMREWVRPIDSLILIEKHPETLQALKRCFKSDPGVAIHARDAYEGLLALLPLKQSRGLIFIDPAFEQPDEWARLINALEKAVVRYRQGVFVIWYPIKASGNGEKEIAGLRTRLPSSIEGLNITVSVLNPDIRQGLIGGGMLVLNPPWQLKNEIKNWLEPVFQALSHQGQGSFSVSNI
jgi:23S rRNA (adenine2030-N6)-methyltransferase